MFSRERNPLALCSSYCLPHWARLAFLCLRVEGAIPFFNQELQHSPFFNYWEKKNHQVLELMNVAADLLMLDLDFSS
jgi:hypothetical protein